MHVKVKVSKWRKWTKYYVVIPKIIVKKLGLRKGEELEVIFNDEEIRFRRVQEDKKASGYPERPESRKLKEGRLCRERKRHTKI